MNKKRKLDMRTFRKPLWRLGAVGIVLAAATFVRAAELPSSMKSRGTIRMLVDPIYPPMEYQDPATGQLMGLDIELGNEIAKRLGLKAEWVQTSFAQLISSLDTDRGDLILSSMGDTPARQETLDFIDYLNIGGQFYTLSTNTLLESEADLCGRGVVTGRATGFPGQIKAWSDENCVKKGRPAINVVDAATIGDSRLQLEQGRADAGAMGGHALRYNMALFAGRFKLIGPPFTGQLAGVSFRKKDTALRDAVHEVMSAMVADATYQKILTRWEMSDLEINPLEINSK